MENISHTVAGLAAGEFIHRSLHDEPDTESQSLRRKVLLVACAVASNFPDLDLVYSNVLTLPNPLGYLLHHRGHTHTILFAFPQALVLIGLMWLLWPKARALLKVSVSARKGLVASVAVGFALHLAMDFLNSYGIHPFYPVDSHWVFGDMVFIVEPFFWVAFATPLLVMMRQSKVRNLLALLLGTLQIVFFAFDLIPLGSLIGLVAMALGLFFLQRGSSSRRALATAFVASLAFVIVQFYSSGLAKRLVTTGLSIRDSASVVLDIAASASPTNPLCWGFVSVEKHESAGTYRITRGRLSLSERLQPVARCSRVTSDPVGETSQIISGMIITGDDTGDLAQLRKLAGEDCNVRAWMRFARVPYVTERFAIDRRFSVQGDGGNFSYLNIEAFGAEKCASHIPKWSFPRADLMGEFD